MRLSSTKNLIATALTAMLMASCADSESMRQQTSHTSHMQKAEGDSTIYGLACEGCNDTIIVMLTNIDLQPDTFNVLQASMLHRVFGRVKTGDEIAIVPNREDGTTADMVIDLQQMKDSWCYMVTPQLRRRASISDSLHQQMLLNMPDSVRRRLLKPVEFGFTLEGNHIVRSIGMIPQQSRDNSPVVYPKVKRYREWHIFNGRLVLSNANTDTLRRNIPTVSDTAEFVQLRRDTLVLRFTNGTQQQYYRK